MSRVDLGLSAAIMTAASLVIAAAPCRAQEAGSAQPTAAQISLGESIFLGKEAGGTCWGCHGKNGKGTGNAPDLTDATWLDADGSLGSIESTITSGVPKPKKFAAPMPPMGGGKLSPDQVKAVAAYVYSLSQKKKK
ncbi:MAG: cytochrome c [Planctomycetota bacterium]|nr:MAG: cytochrome c [Planctomycetota bacterium]